MLRGERQRILLLIPHLGGGGAERVAALVADRLPEWGFDVHLAAVTPDAPGAGPRHSRVTLHRLGVERVRQGWLRILRLVWRLRPRVILCGMAHLNLLLLLLRPLLPPGTRIAIRQNGLTAASLAGDAAPWLPRSVYRQIYRLLYRRADHLIAQSRSMAAELQHGLGMAQDRIAVLPNPVDVDRIRNGMLGAGAGEAGNSRYTGPGPHLLAVGRLSREKGYDLLLSALAAIRASYPNADLTVLGTGPEEAALRALAGELGLADAVRWIGHVDEPSTYYPGATLFALSSRHDAMPNALLEAGFAGLPLVATPCSGGVIDLLTATETKADAEQAKPWSARTAPGTWLAADCAAESLAQTLRDALDQIHAGQVHAGQVHPGLRFEHAFLQPYTLESAMRGYAELVARLAGGKACAEDGGSQSDRNPGGRRDSVALVIPTIDQVSGAERQVMLLAKGLARRGWRVTVIALAGSGGAAAEELAAANVGYRSLGMRKGLADPRGWLRMRQWLRANRPRVAHAHLPHAVWLARWARLLAPVPVLVDTLHTSSIGTLGRQWGYRLSNRLSDGTTAVSQAVAESWARAGVVPRAKLHSLPNGIDLSRFQSCSATRQAMRARLREDLEWNGEFLWLAVGRLAPVKDYPTLLRAFAQLPRGSSRLLILGSAGTGDGPRQAALRALADELAIADHAHFLGFQNEPERWMQAADGYVLSSLWEGLPMGPLEAGAAGLPAVATAAPGTSEAILDGVTGLLTPVGDPGALSRAMLAIQQMPEEQRQAMGRRAREHVAARFSLDSVLDQWEALYRRLPG